MKNQNYQTLNYSLLVGLGIGILYSLLPMKYINGLIFKVKAAKPEKLTFSEAKEKKIIEMVF